MLDIRIPNPNALPTFGLVCMHKACAIFFFGFTPIGRNPSSIRKVDQTEKNKEKKKREAQRKQAGGRRTVDGLGDGLSQEDGGDWHSQLLLSL